MGHHSARLGTQCPYGYYRDPRRVRTRRGSLAQHDSAPVCHFNKYYRYFFQGYAFDSATLRGCSRMYHMLVQERRMFHGRMAKGQHFIHVPGPRANSQIGRSALQRSFDNLYSGTSHRRV